MGWKAKTALVTLGVFTVPGIASAIKGVWNAANVPSANFMADDKNLAVKEEYAFNRDLIEAVGDNWVIRSVGTTNWYVAGVGGLLIGAGERCFRHQAANGTRDASEPVPDRPFGLKPPAAHKKALEK